MIQHSIFFQNKSLSLIAAKACSGINDKPDLFSFRQCTSIGIKPILENCLPTDEIILSSIKRTIQEFPNIQSVFMASDSKGQKEQFIKEYLERHFPLFQTGLAYLGSVFMDNLVSENTHVIFFPLIR